MIAKLLVATVAVVLVSTVPDVSTFALAAIAAVFILCAPSGAESDRPCNRP